MLKRVKPDAPVLKKTKGINMTQCKKIMDEFLRSQEGYMPDKFNGFITYPKKK